MKVSVKNVAAILGVASIVACTNTPNTIKEMSDQNIFLQAYSGPYEGVPAFDKMEVSMLKEAIQEGIALHLTEIDAIANNSEAATFENTIVPYEKSGAALKRAFVYYNLYSSNLSTPEFRAIEKALSPEIADYRSKISQNKALFARIKTVYENSVTNPLAEQEQRLVNLIYQEFEMGGANLSEKDKARYAAIQKELSELYTKFSNNLLADEEDYVTYIDSTQLGGLPESFVKSAYVAAEEHGEKGKYAITNTRSSMDPFLTYSDERGLREKVWRTYYSRGNNGDAKDNNAVVLQILKLRNERVGLLGFDDYATWRLQDRMAKNPDNAMRLMENVWPAALARVAEEVAEMEQVAKKMGDNVTIEPWDYRYYMEKVRKEKYDLDSEEVKQYLELNNLREAMFYVAGELFNYKFTPVEAGKVPVFQEDVKVWEVTDKDSGKLIGLWYLDPYARSGKRSGAWATTYRRRTEILGNKPVLASNNSNFVKPSPGEPILVSWDDAETFFHEFGHALHYLTINVKYPYLTGGVRDYTEFQSQLLERWLLSDAVIHNYLKHYKTGAPMPESLVAKIKNTATFNQGFATTEFLASALMDMIYHTTDPETIKDVQEFEKQQLASLGMPSEIPMRHRTTQFAHIFDGEGYAAAYYGYLWAEVLTADAAEAFAEAPGGYYDKALAKKLIDYLFAPGNSIDPAEAYKEFRGKDAGIEPLMRDRGFPVK